MEVSKLIKEKRLEKGLTMKEVAKYVGVSEASISKWEAGYVDKIRSDKLMKLAEILGLSVLDLVMTEDEREARKEKMKKTKISDEQLRYALFNGEEVTDEQYEEVLRFRDYVLQRDKK